MTSSGGWHGQEQRHGRHRQGATGAAWTPVVRPTDTGPAHAWRDGLPRVAWPTDTAPAWPVSEVLTRRPGWPVEDLELPAARVAQAQRDEGVLQRTGREEGVLQRESGRAAAPPERKTVSADMVLDTVPMGPVKASAAVVHTLLETTATGLRKFDLGNVPASVTPPRSWRRAAWFAVGTSAAVVLGLAVAAVEFMGRPVDDNVLIDALPAYPTRPLTLDELPNEKTATEPSSRARPSTTSRPTDTPAASQPRLAAATDEPVRNTVAGSSTTDTQTSSELPSHGTTMTIPKEPVRRTVGPAPVTPTDPQAMGDRTEDYFALVTSDAAAAHALTTGGLAREGAEGIEARYAGVRRIEVQDITIDRNQAITTSTIKIIREDGTEIVERRQLTFTWGGDPKITDELVTG